ncbi:MAG: flagellar basal body P-ring protein FlgI [Planctomycetes bacterium]|nr:flagellar basal body P-ring protein FlgI [Planctomycetota bacterium]
MLRLILCVCCCLPLLSAQSLFDQDGVRLKDLITIAGERDNQLMGFGVVVGLEGTGDKGLATTNT